MYAGLSGDGIAITCQMFCVEERGASCSARPREGFVGGIG